MECVTRFGLATFSLARRHSTTELHTHNNGASSRIWTDDLVITNHLLYRWAIEAGEREFFRLFLAATKWLVKMLDYLLSATSETHYLSPPRSFNVEIGVLKRDLKTSYTNASPIRLFIVDELRHLVGVTGFEPATSWSQITPSTTDLRPNVPPSSRRYLGGIGVQTFVRHIPARNFIRDLLLPTDFYWSKVRESDPLLRVGSALLDRLTNPA